jgi:diguanylate cyclase (GGDEF)-like protein
MYREMFDKGIEWRAHAHSIRRLYGNWLALREQADAVPFSEFDPASLGPVADDMIVFRPTADGDMVYSHYGRALVERVGTDMTGKSSTRILETIGQFFRECNNRVLATDKPLLTIHRSAIAGQVHLWERLVLPCRESSGAPVIVIIAKPRQFRDDLLAAVLDASLDAIMAVRLVRDDSGTPVDGEFVAVNRRAADWNGHTVEGMLQSPVLTLCPHLATTGLWVRFVDVALTRQSLQLVIHHACADADRWIEIACVPFGDGFMVTKADVTERKNAEDAMRQTQAEYARANAALKAEIFRRQALEEELSKLATRDSLTGALNRRATTEGLRDALASSARYAHPVSIITVDLDHFKAINDRFGHAGGDAVLRRTVRLLTHGLREDVDLVGRFGGEEFVMVLPHVGVAEAAGVACRMRELLAGSPVEHEDGPIRFSGSFGVAAWDGRETMDRLLSRADAALYRAKAAGRNRVALDEGMGEVHVLDTGGDATLQPSGEIPPFTPTTRQGTAPRRPRRAIAPALPQP